jgi:hypothetical protein
MEIEQKYFKKIQTLFPMAQQRYNCILCDENFCICLDGAGRYYIGDVSGSEYVCKSSKFSEIFAVAKAIKKCNGG